MDCKQVAITDPTLSIGTEVEKSSNVIQPKDLSEEDRKPIKYPKHVFFIIGNEFCERFCYYGNRTILAIYLTDLLKYSESDATVIYHAFVMICYFFPVFGAIIADCYLGKFRTILYLSIVYAIGCVVLAISSQMSIPINHTVFSLLGLLFIAIGTGGIKPCVSAFGGDQFVVPQQQKQLASFFDLFYLFTNAGTMISTYVTPELRVQHCFGQDSCFPIAFGIPAILMLTSLILFVCGSPMYKINKPQGNIIVDVSKVVGRGIQNKVKSKEKKNHWLDYASDKYSAEIINETKILIEVIYMLSPAILYATLSEQQGPVWTFQAAHMNGKIGSFTIQPDQMLVINPVLILFLIPLFQVVIYPLFAKLKLLTAPLERMFWGGMCVALCIAMSAVVEHYVQDSYPILPKSNEAQLRIYNSFNCSLQVNAVSDDKTYNWTISSLVVHEETISPISAHKTFNYSATFVGENCPNLSSTAEAMFTVYEKEAVSYVTDEDNNGTTEPVSTLVFVRIDSGFDDLEKSNDAIPKVRIVYRLVNASSFELSSSDGSTSGTLSAGSHSTDVYTVPSGSHYSLKVNDATVATNLDINVGGVYSLLVAQNLETQGKLFTLTNPNTVHILWQLPQIVTVTVAEILFSVTGLKFSYSQAPQRMKSVVSSYWLLTDSIGNLLVVLVTEATQNISTVYLLIGYSVSMAVVMLGFLLIARRFTREMKKLSSKQLN